MTTKTRCKMKVERKEAHRAWNPETRLMDGEIQGYSIDLRAVYDSNPESENGRFFQATPCAEVKLGVINPGGAAVFEEGMEMYVDFTPVE